MRQWCCVFEGGTDKCHEEVTMAKPKNLECESCEAVFHVQYEMDDHFYEPRYCVFCGTELEIEEELELYDQLTDEEY